MAIDELPMRAGWYPDPEAVTGQRWWNGSQWTTHTRQSPAPGEAIALDGLAPTAWSTVAAPVATAWPSLPTQTSMFAVDDPNPIPPPPTPLAISPGWYPDPNGLPAQRWWNGTAWTEHAAPIPRIPPPPPPYRQSSRYGDSPVNAPYGSTVVVVNPPKSVGVAFVLTFFFGPLGMFYSTVSGALIMLGVLIVGGFFAGIITLGVAWLFWWPLCWIASMVWGCVAAAEQPAPHVTGYR